MSASAATTYRYCGRLFTADQMEQIRDLIASDPKRNRLQLSRLVCDQLGWFMANGRRKEMSCRVAMLRMHRDGLIRLPPPQKGNGNGQRNGELEKLKDLRTLIIGQQSGRKLSATTVETLKKWIQDGGMLIGVRDHRLLEA